MKFNLFTFEIPPEQTERIIAIIEKLLPTPWQLMSFILGAVLFGAVFAAAIYVWKC